MITFAETIPRDPDINIWTSNGWETFEIDSRDSRKFVMFVSDTATFVSDNMVLSRKFYNGFIADDDIARMVPVAAAMGRLRHAFLSNDLQEIDNRKRRLNRKYNLNYIGRKMKTLAEEDNITAFG